MKRCMGSPYFVSCHFPVFIFFPVLGFYHFPVFIFPVHGFYHCPIYVGRVFCIEFSMFICPVRVFPFFLVPGACRVRFPSTWVYLCLLCPFHIRMHSTGRSVAQQGCGCFLLSEYFSLSARMDPNDGPPEES